MSALRESLTCAIVATFLGTLPAATKSAPCPVVVSPTAEPCESWAAAELSSFLHEIYTADRFPVVASAPATGDYIWLGDRSRLGDLKPYVRADEVDEPGEFVVKQVGIGSRQVGIICGHHPRAVLDGVHALLEKQLGQAFYLYRSASENAATGSFDFRKWDLADRPLVGERICFNWYNFISGVSSWNLPDYQHWIRQAARMQHTEVMLHTYGWGPFTQFTHNGVTKSVEYLQNTAYGSHWGVVHTQDVRQLIGGEALADDGPVFGADVGKVGYGGITEENRVAMAKAMLREAIDYAVHTVGIGFNWSIDVDTTYANPQEIITTLPEADRIQVGDHWLARPDTDNGYRFFRKIIETTMRDFPAISKITLWWRGKANAHFGGLVLNMKPSDLPEAWRPRYDQSPDGVKSSFGPGQLYHAEVAMAFRRALDELGHAEVSLGYGSWSNRNNHANFVAADHFMPPAMTCYSLDYDMRFGESRPYRDELKAIASHRPLVVIEWAQHDDGKYLGRPYLPPEAFATKLGEVDASGYGVIHWMTRPLDVFFKNLQQQVWRSTVDEPIASTCRRMAVDFFGEPASGIMSPYLYDWMTTAPQFGRETGDALGNPGVGAAVKDHDQRARDCDRRIALLDQVDPTQLSPLALEAWQYFRGHEQWIQQFHLAQKAWDPEMREMAIRTYAEKAAHDGGMTRGEQGVLIQHNLKWQKPKGRKKE